MGGCHTVHYTLGRSSGLYDRGMKPLELLSFFITDRFRMSQIFIHSSKVSDVNGLIVAKIDCKCLT